MHQSSPVGISERLRRRRDTLSIYQRNAKPGLPCHAAAYKRLRHSIRNLRRMHPTHPDVAWFERSLGLDPVDISVTHRHTYALGVCGIGITGPVGTLP